MPKKTENYVFSLGEALKTFDLKILKKWMKKNNRLMWEEFKKKPETVQMATMCKMICNRTDLLATQAHFDAVRWLNEHNMCGGLW